MHRRAVAAVVLLAVVVLATVAILVAQQRPAPDPGPSPTTQTTQSTLLVQLRGSSLLAVGSVLTGIDEGKRLDQLYWTGDWWVDQEGIQEVSAAELGRKPVPYVMETLQNQTQVRLDDAWVLDRLAFAGLVDAVGGVRVSIPKTTAYINEAGVPVLLSRGVQDMSGAEAADFVIDRSLRDEQARMIRFEQVWDQILRRFPADPQKARTLVVSLGALSKSTMTTEGLAGYLSQAHELRITGQAAQAQVPLDTTNLVRVRPPQGVRVAYALDQRRMPERIDGLFPQFGRPEFPIARVQAAYPRAQAVTQVRDALDTRGWVSAWGGRTEASTNAVAVAADVPQDDVVALEQALGEQPVTRSLPWGQARVVIGVGAPVQS